VLYLLRITRKRARLKDKYDILVSFNFVCIKAVNTVCQGSGADLIKKAMMDIQHEMDKQHLKSHLLVQIHDELLFEVYKDELDRMKEMVKTKMENVVTLRVKIPVKVKVGQSWGTMQ
jgi:DNA polymerase-1